MSLWESESLSSFLRSIHSWEDVQTFLKGIVLGDMESLPSELEGQIFHHEKKFYLTSANRRVISRASDALLIPVTVANTITETTLYTGSVAANTLFPGKVYRVSIYGKFSTANASDSLKLRVKLNGVTLADIDSVLGNVTNKAGSVKTYLTVRSVGATGIVSCFCSFQLDEKIYHADISSTTVDTTTGNNIEITTQWDAANEGDTITINQGFLEAMG